MREYDLIAAWYVNTRGPATGVPELDALVAPLAPGASVLDVGCGHGLPLTRRLVDHGFDVVGVDSSLRMVERFRRNLPDTRVIHAPIQDAVLPAARFDAAHAWGVIFHLPHSEQARAFAAVARALRPGGRFLFTAGDRGEEGDGGIDGEPMHGVPFHYWGLAPEGYRTLLGRYGLRLLSVEQDAGRNTYYRAEKE